MPLMYSTQGRGGPMRQRGVVHLIYSLNAWYCTAPAACASFHRQLTYLQHVFGAIFQLVTAPSDLGLWNLCVPVQSTTTR